MQKNEPKLFYDVVVIGSGIPGMVTAAKLSKNGKKVLLLERSSKLGGCSSELKRNILLSLYSTEDPRTDPCIKKILSELDSSNKLKFARLPSYRHTITTERRFNIFINKEMNIQILSGLFPSEKAGIRTFFDKVEKIRNLKKKNEALKLLKTKTKREICGWLLKKSLLFIESFIDSDSDLNVSIYIDRVIKDEYLKSIILANITHHHSSPKALPMSSFSCLEYSLNERNCYVESGLQGIMKLLEEVILNHDGHILTDTTSETINIKKSFDYVESVQVRNLKTDKVSIIKTKIIVANCSPHVLGGQLLPHSHSPFYKEIISKFQIGNSVSTIYMKLNKPLNCLGWTNYNTLIKPSKPPISRGNYNEKSFSFIDYSQINNNSLDSEENLLCSATFPDQYNYWIQMDEEDYKVSKERLVAVAIARIEAIIPDFRDALESVELVTPVDVERIMQNNSGSIYGFSESKLNVKLYKKMESKLKFHNIYLSSSWSSLSMSNVSSIKIGWSIAGKILQNSAYLGNKSRLLFTALQRISFLKRRTRKYAKRQMTRLKMLFPKKALIRLLDLTSDEE